jgi:hypothetical protein
MKVALAEKNSNVETLKDELLKSEDKLNHVELDRKMFETRAKEEAQCREKVINN